MAFVEQEDVLQTFEGLVQHLFKSVRGVDLDDKFPRMTYAEAMERYGSDKPDIRFGMELNELTEKAQGKVLLFLTVLSRSLPSMPKDVQAILESSLMP